MDRSERLIRAGLVLASDLSLETVLQRIVDEAVDLTDATYGALGVLGPDGRIAEFVTTGITPEQRAAIGDPPTGHGILGLLIRDPRPVRIPNLADHELSYGFPPNHPLMTSFLGAPVSARGTVFGNLYLTNKKGATEFDQADEDALVVLAAQAGIAIENARLYAEAGALREEVERLAVLEDRERIAKDLHDGVIQSLFAVGMGLQGTSMVSGDPQIADRALDAALRELAAEFEQRSGIVTVAEIDPVVAAELSAVAGEVLQLAREGLSNVGRHSAATTCRLSLVRVEDSAVLEVDDDGKGFDPSATPRGDGLTNLEQRADAAGGRVVVDSGLGRGTTVRVEFPL